ncbi:MAG: cysteine-rich CWC family protein [Acidobacteria bacterium]|nr:cysteine-rich CWC family protein [Acidobacteriota bacterium]
MRLRSIANVLTTRFREPSQCPACRGEFVCGATITGCWCTATKLSDEVRAELKRRYSGCLCRNCLARLSEGEPVDALATPTGVHPD